MKDLTAAGSQFVLPVTMVRPRNPLNNTYLPVINASAFPSIVTPGGKSPDLILSTFVKTSFFSAAFINALLITQDAVGDTHDWAVGMYDVVAAGYRVFDWSKVSSVELSGNAAGGNQTLQIAMDSLFGDSELNSGTTPINGFAQTTFSASGVTPDAGQAASIASVSLTGASRVRSYRLSLVRGQGVQRWFSGNLYGSGISTGMWSGVLTLEYEPKASTVPTSAVTLTIAGVTFSLNLNLDVFSQDFSPSQGTAIRTYSLINLSTGGNPASVS